MLNRNNTDKVYGNLVNGEWVMSTSNRTLEITSPVDRSFVGKIQLMVREEIVQVIQSA